MAVKRNFFNKMNLRGVVCDCKAGENFKGISGLFEFLNRDPNSKSIIQKVGSLETPFILCKNVLFI